MQKYLKESAEKLSICLTEEQLEKFYNFYELLIETNKSLNLTAITEMHEVVLKHFIDSIAIIKYIDFSGKRIIDVGTGAGFPGIPLAILFPDAKFLLMDSLQKRITFIENVLEKCLIKNVDTVHARAEDIGQNAEYREKYDYCLSRAVAPLPTLLELCTPFVRVGGSFLSYKSELLEEELKKSKRALEVLHCKIEEQYHYSIPDSDFYRVLAVFKKEAKLQKKYPRQAGKPKREPL
ncbi:MAG: 16S rRNA (guanine(527)-N(7))-methyltransferase RsmG [Lachnospiraceae bacterium]|nr:16S rRNA (guanine(527)-N(7))-methyltransferase RsmG [Lachnospiraceae bacterium]